jgi:hypothetical protein
MKLSLVLEDVGGGPQIILSTDNTDEATRFYKAHQSEMDSKVYLVINPPVTLNRKIKVEAKPAPISFAPRKK